MTFWGYSIFNDKANQLYVDRVKQWGSQKGVDVDAVLVNENDLPQRISAAVESNTLPDVFDSSMAIVQQLSAGNHLEPLDDLFEQIGKQHGGWLKPAEASTNPASLKGIRYAVPYGTGGDVLYRRADVLEKAGFTNPPKTWQELAEAAAAAQDPPKYYGMGFALSNTFDANQTTRMLQSWGGRIADDAGKTCTIDSPETRQFLTWITDAYKKGLFPPGVTTWDGAGDNTAYQSGNALFIANPGSVYLYMKDNDPDLLKTTKFSALPGGPKLRLSPVFPTIRAISATSQNKALAKDLIAYLMGDDFMQAYYTNGVYGPVLNSQVDFPIFKESPVHQGLLDLAKNGTPSTYPDVDNPAFAEYDGNLLTPKMVQRVVVDGKSIDEAVKEAQAACQAIYDKYK